ncbi:MAG: hypothetical protein PHC61_03925 [Chitinivibrionales bacterium]|nr:hypothetical protein [Chitinivibrionales bacterium]
MAKDKISSSGACVSDLESGYKSRLEESKLLLGNGYYLSSIYLGGYAFELLLKIIICKKLGLTDLPSCFTIHDFESLLYSAGLSDERGKDPKVSANFTYVNSSWSEGKRYDNPSKYSVDSASKFYAALTDSKEGGLIPWLEQIVAKI